MYLEPVDRCRNCQYTQSHKTISVSLTIIGNDEFHEMDPSTMSIVMYLLKCIHTAPSEHVTHNLRYLPKCSERAGSVKMLTTLIILRNIEGSITYKTCPRLISQLPSLAIKYK